MMPSISRRLALSTAVLAAAFAPAVASAADVNIYTSRQPELIQPLLDDRRLVRVEAALPAQPSGHAYWLIQAEPRPREEVRHVAEWLVAEAKGAAPR